MINKMETITNQALLMKYWNKRYEKFSHNHSLQNKIISKDFLKFCTKEFNDVFSESKSIIEIGCGTGEMCELIHKEFSIEKMLGLDVSPKAAEHSNKNIKNASFECFDCSKNMSAYKGFDLSISSNTLEHFKNPGLVIKNMMKISKYSMIIVPYNQPLTDGYDGEGGAGHVFRFTKKSFDKYPMINSFIFFTAGWVYSSEEEDPLQLAVLLKND